MNRRSLFLLLALAALWGASYLFIKIALDDLSPAGIVFVRTALAAAVLLPFAIKGGGMTPLWRRFPGLALLAAVQVAGPFLLISAGERHIASSLAGILVASTPIFTAIIAIWVDRDERVSASGAAGVALGIVGVALLLGVDLSHSSSAFGGGVMVLLAGLGYAIGALALKRYFTGYQPLALVAGTMTASALMTLPLFLIDLPSQMHFDTAAAMGGLGLGGTGLAFVIYYTLNHEIGPTRTSLVAYIAPVFAVFYGVTLLDEGFGITTALGVVLIIGGSWVAARAPARAPVEPAAARASAQA